MTELQSREAQVVARVCMALPGVAPAGTGIPSLRRTESMRSRMMKTCWPMRGFGPEGNEAVMMTRMAARVGAGVTDGDGAGAAEAVAAGVAGPAEEVAGVGVSDGAAGGVVVGVLAAMAVEDVADEGVKVATLHCWDFGVKVTLSPFIPETSRPLTVVAPVPRRVLSGATARVNGPPLLLTWMRS